MPYNIETHTINRVFTLEMLEDCIHEVFSSNPTVLNQIDHYGEVLSNIQFIQPRSRRRQHPMNNKKIRNIQIRYYNVMYDELQKYIMNQPFQMFSFKLPWKFDEDYDITGMRVASNADKTVYALIKNRNTGEEFEEDIIEYTIPEVETIVHHIW